METPYQILTREEVKDPENDLPNITVWLANSQERILIRIKDFPNFIYVEIPDNLSPTGKWNKTLIGELLENLDIDLDFSFKRREKFFGYSKTRYPTVTLYSYDSYGFEGVQKKLTDYFLKKETLKNPKIDKKILRKFLGVNIHHGNFTLLQKFTAVTNLNPGNWVSINKDELIPYDPGEEGEPWSDLPTYFVPDFRLKKIDKPPDKKWFPNLRVLCIDFEVNSSRRNKFSNQSFFPDPWEPNDLIYLVSIVQGETVTKKKHGTIIVVKDLPFDYVKNDDGAEPSPIIKVETELELLKTLEDKIKEYDPDIITGYNIHGFDFPYWKARYESIGESLGCFGRLLFKPCTFKACNWASSAHKARNQELMMVPGVPVIDLYTIIRRDTFHEIYTLEYISSQILGDKAKKDDLPAEEQFRIYREGTLKEWEKLLHYSIRDSWAPLDIMDKLSTVANLMVTGSIIGINIDDIYSRGQQYRLENMLFRSLMPKGIIVNANKDVKNKKFKGALVQDPLCGKHINVATLDFNSLYPTVMIHFNISHDTYVGTNLEVLPDGLTWEDVNKIEIPAEGNELARYHIFVKHHIHVGELSNMLRILLDTRKERKNQMKKETDPILYANLDAEQSALKVVANSAYGFLGTGDKGKCPLPEGAEAVTAMGRMLITMVADRLRDYYKATIIGGDTDSIFFTLPQWKNRYGEANVIDMTKESEEIADEISKNINKPPIKIALDHFYTRYICLKKKCYFSAEVDKKIEKKMINGIESISEKLISKLSYKGVPIVRRESSHWFKRIYKRSTMIALGGLEWEENSTFFQQKWEFEMSIWRGVTELLSRQVPWSDLTKITQINKESKEYKSTSYPLRLFLEREIEQGRPILIGERIKWFVVKTIAEKELEIKKCKKVDKKPPLMGLKMRRKIEDGEYLDTDYYLKTLTIPVKRIAEHVFKDKTMFVRILKDIKTKKKLMEEIIERPWPNKIKWKKWMNED